MYKDELSLATRRTAEYGEDQDDSAETRESIFVASRMVNLGAVDLPVIRAPIQQWLT